MDIGMPTLLELETVEECVYLCRKLNLQFVELNMNLPQYQTSTIDVEKINYLRKHDGIYFTLHLDENLNVCDFNPSISSAYLTTVLETIELARQIQAPILNMHFHEGVYFTLPERREYLFERFEKHYLDHLTVFKKMMQNAIGGEDILLCIENTSGFHSFSKEGIRLLLDSSVFGLTFDVGHDFCIHNKDREFILENRNRLKHMHLHDADDRQCHLPIGDGKINITEQIEIAKKTNCRIVLETKTVEALCRSAVYLHHHLYR